MHVSKFIELLQKKIESGEIKAEDHLVTIDRNKVISYAVNISKTNDRNINNNPEKCALIKFDYNPSRKEGNYE